jgi:CRISPR system Cascade subunit CasE
MYFSQIRPAEGFAYAAPIRQHYLRAGSYGPHQLVWLVFGDHKDRRRDFLYRFDPRREEHFVCHAVSEREPQSVDGLDVRTKPYDPKLKAGDHLAFRLRANPTISRKDDQGKSRRHDVLMDAKKAAKENGEEEDLKAIMEAAALDWLRSRAEQAGFVPLDDSLRLESYRPERFCKGRTGQKVSLGVADYAGILEATDPAAFGKTLANGLGHGKAFGCGLLLVRPV